MWFLNDLGRLNRERNAVQALEEASAWLDGVQWQLDSAAVIINADIVLSDNQRYPICLRFPEHYPSVPPSVRPREPERWSSHQYDATGDLCLELGPDNWHPDTHNASHMLQSTYRLLTLEADHAEDSGVEIPSRHQLTDGQLQRTEVFRWVVTPAARAALDSIPDGTAVRCEMYLMYHELALTAFVRRIEHPDTEDWIDHGVPVELKRLGRTAMGVIVTGQQGALTLASLNEPAALTTFLSKQAVPAPKDNEADAGLDNVEFVIVKGFGSEWQALWRWRSGEKVSFFSTLHADMAPPNVRHGYDAGSLSEVTVAIVGLGSAGSKIATSLARSGVGHFVLLDDDLLHPCNLVRHDSDWFEVGQHKVDAVADRLMLINPGVNIVRRKHRLNGQESTTSAASALASLGQADVIIDATANPTVFNLCAHVARHSKKSFIWLEIYAGGIGGLVARARPDKDPEPFTLREAINAAAADIAAEKGVEPPDGAGDYAAFDADEAVVIASDADVTTIAGIAAQIALDTLLDREPSNYPYSGYLVGLSRGWIFEQPLHTIPVTCTAPIDWSTVVDTDKATRTEAAAFVVQLLEEHTRNADTASTE